MGITAVDVDESYSTVGDTFSTVEVVQYSGRSFSTVHLGYLQYMWGITSVQWGIVLVLWRVFSTVGEIFNFNF